MKPLTENPETKVEVLVQALFFARWCNRDHTLVELNPNLLSNPKSLKQALAQGDLFKDKLQEWTEALIFENLKPEEITKKLFQHHLKILKNV